MQAVYLQLTELHRYPLAIQNAPVLKSALKAVQLRLDQNSSDPIFATRQMAKHCLLRSTAGQAGWLTRPGMW